MEVFEGTGRYMKSILQREMRHYCREKYGYKIYNQVYAEIYGKPMYLNEIEVRYLSVKCKKFADEGKFDEFTRNHVIYSGRTKRRHHPMHWNENGWFDDDFEPGFFGVASDLSIEIL